MKKSINYASRAPEIFWRGNKKGLSKKDRDKLLAPLRGVVSESDTFFVIPECLYRESSFFKKMINQSPWIPAKNLPEGMTDKEAR
jgi:hypothetical protein